MATKKTVNKSAFVRSLNKLKPAEIVEAAKKKGIKLTVAYVYSIRSADKNKKPTGATERPVAVGSTGPVGSTRHVSMPLDTERELALLIVEVGLCNAQRVFDHVRSTVSGF